MALPHLFSVFPFVIHPNVNLWALHYAIISSPLFVVSTISPPLRHHSSGLCSIFPPSPGFVTDLFYYIDSTETATSAFAGGPAEEIQMGLMPIIDVINV